MSHVEALAVTVRQMNGKPHAALYEAAKEFGGVITKADTYGWFGRHVGDWKLPAGFKAGELGKCQFKITIPGCPYEIGLVEGNGTKERPAGTYTMLFDFWGPGQTLLKTFGKRLDNLCDSFNYHQIKMGLKPGQKCYLVKNQEQARKLNASLGLMGKERVMFKGKPQVITTH